MRRKAQHHGKFRLNLFLCHLRRLHAACNYNDAGGIAPDPFRKFPSQSAAQVLNIVQVQQSALCFFPQSGIAFRSKELSLRSAFRICVIPAVHLYVGSILRKNLTGGGILVHLLGKMALAGSPFACNNRIQTSGRIQNGGLCQLNSML